ncbi:putative sulfite oxidase subunit YedZ [Citrobacter koseri]|uniref:Putative sulfite oxidase subunit YedZ n=1 Tax=Citrobacter koseri TaxID=545 RepID=A0A2X2WA19_CITKO|nr:putative sulfite oxidase subunit YedZ [Citrobacter koseri]
MPDYYPFLWLVWAVNQGGLSADPVKDIQHFTGRTALKFLLATLLVSPLARYAKQPLLIRTRRLLGLWCFAWATLHLTSYALLELGINNLALLGPGVNHSSLFNVGHYQLVHFIRPYVDLHAGGATKTGETLATFA